jgi:hypothetical protein
MAARKTAEKRTAATAPDVKATQEEAEGPVAAGGVLVVTAPRARRRAGFAFGPEPVRVTVADLTDEQLLAIESDPLLTVKRD